MNPIQPQESSALTQTDKHDRIEEVLGNFPPYSTPIVVQYRTDNTHTDARRTEQRFDTNNTLAMLSVFVALFCFMASAGCAIFTAFTYDMVKQINYEQSNLSRTGGLPSQPR